MAQEARAMESSEDLTPEEAAYFSSRGEDTSFANQQQDTAPAPAPQQMPDEMQHQASEQQDLDDDVDMEDGDQLITVGPDGKPRNTENGRFVPHSAYLRVNGKYKSARDENQALREQVARANERLNVLNDVIRLADVPQSQQQEAEPPPPNPEEDLFGFVKWQAEKIQRLEAQQNNFVQSAQQQQQLQQASQEIQSYYESDARSFMEAQPDFPDAYQYIAQSYANELRAQGVPDSQVNTMLLAEEARIAMHGKQTGTSAAKIIYEMAKARGYQAKQAAPQQQQPNANEEKLRNIQRAKSASVSLSGAGGTSGEGLTLEALVSMSDEEFAATQERLGKAKMRQLLGG